MWVDVWDIARGCVAVEIGMVSYGTEGWVWCIVLWSGVVQCEYAGWPEPHPMHSLGGSTAQDHTFRLIQRPSGSPFACHDGRGVEQVLRTQLRTFDSLRTVLHITAGVSNRCYTQSLCMFDGMERCHMSPCALKLGTLNSQNANV